MRHAIKKKTIGKRDYMYEEMKTADQKSQR